MTSLVDLFLPPIVTKGIRRLTRPKPVDDLLFGGDDAAFVKLVANARVYGEYGVGLSTQYVHDHGTATILAVDSSRHWIATVGARLSQTSRVDLRWVDLGETGAWGRPLSYGARARFIDYVTSIWTRGEKPDLVLIDGRFRVCCLLISLLRADPGTMIVFDDYSRPKYRLIEEFVPVLNDTGRQAIIRVPEILDREAIQREADRFLYVMD